MTSVELKMEKMIIELMEFVTLLTKREINDEMKLVENGECAMPYLMREILQNEINRREGKRHLDHRKARKDLERKLTALD